ncbi:unnamed protein product, partial [Ixodes hexagonus]
GKELAEAELLERAAEERAAIVARYDRGRENVADIDPWEDPKFELYHVTDKYGFIHTSRLPDKYTGHEAKVSSLPRPWPCPRPHSLPPQRTPAWPYKQKYFSLEKSHREIQLSSEGFCKRSVWEKGLLHGAACHEHLSRLQEMRERARKWSPDIRQIDLDVNRTYRNHIMFRERYSVKQQALFHVLAAYSVYNTEVGYCQGMSQIAALLLMYMNEEASSEVVVVVQSPPCPTCAGFFIQGFPKLRRFQEHHDRVLGRLLPKLKKHLDRYEMHTSLYTLKWFFQCFLDRVPFTLTLRLWDAYVLDGEPVLTAMSYTLLRLHRKTLLRQGMEEMIEFLQARLEQDFGFHDDAAMEALQAAMEELRRQGLQVPPGRPPPDELPQRPFGLELPPQVLAPRNARSRGERWNRRTITNRPNRLTDKRLARTDMVMNLRGCRRRGSGDSCVQLTNGGSRTSSPARPVAEDTASSLLDPLSSRNSLAETSQTSAADLSSFSSPTLLRRTPSLYDNVDYGESLEAAATLARGSPEGVRILVAYGGSGEEEDGPVTPVGPNGDVTPTNQDPNKITIHVGLQPAPLSTEL